MQYSRRRDIQANRVNKKKRTRSCREENEWNSSVNFKIFPLNVLYFNFLRVTTATSQSSWRIIQNIILNSFTHSHFISSQDEKGCHQIASAWWLYLPANNSCRGVIEISSQKLIKYKELFISFNWNIFWSFN